jgi:hypothetical protein
LQRSNIDLTTSSGTARLPREFVPSDDFIDIESMLHIDVIHRIGIPLRLMDEGADGLPARGHRIDDDSLTTLHTLFANGLRDIERTRGGPTGEIIAFDHTMSGFVIDLRGGIDHMPDGICADYHILKAMLLDECGLAAPCGTLKDENLVHDILFSRHFTYIHIVSYMIVL